MSPSPSAGPRPGWSEEFGRDRIEHGESARAGDVGRWKHPHAPPPSGAGDLGGARNADQVESPRRGDELDANGGTVGPDVDDPTVAKLLLAHRGARRELFVGSVGPSRPKGLRSPTFRATRAGPDLLAFADIEPVLAPSFPLELQIAVKVHAYTRDCGQSGNASTRVKDLVDGRRRAVTGSDDPPGSGGYPLTSRPMMTPASAAAPAIAIV
jgi:hypothetical protein